MGLVEYAENELKREGMFDKDSDYEGMLGKSVMDLMEVFSKQGHSGFSAMQTIKIFTRLASWKPLSPPTNNPDEWIDVSEMSGTPMWQNERDSTYFSKDGGKTMYSIDDKESK